MPQPWLRLHNEFLTDWRIESLSFEDQRHFIAILILKNMGILDADYPSEEIRDRTISRKLGLQGEAFESAKQRLFELQLIDVSWSPLAWSKRQYLSDSSTDRVRKHRENKKKSDVTDAKRFSNDDVAPPDTDTDTDTDKNMGEKSPFDEFWEAYPKKRGKAEARQRWDKLKPSQKLRTQILAAISNQKQSRDWIKDGGQFIPYPATWLNKGCWDDEIDAKAKPGGYVC